jgi:SAM-dependent methyltransferase
MLSVAHCCNFVRASPCPQGVLTISTVRMPDTRRTSGSARSSGSAATSPTLRVERKPEHTPDQRGSRPHPNGTALDVGAGEGADGLWLADRGWQVTATDISTVALDRGASHAREAGTEVAARIDWLHADLTTWVPQPMTYNLVSAQFMHLPKPQRDAMVARLATSVAAGGTLLIVGQHPSDLQTTIPRPPMPELFFTAAEIADTLNPEEWDILVSDARPRNATDPDGRTVTIYDAVLRAQRHPS